MNCATSGDVLEILLPDTPHIKRAMSGAEQGSPLAFSLFGKKPPAPAPAKPEAIKPKLPPVAAPASADAADELFPLELATPDEEEGAAGTPNIELSLTAPQLDPFVEKAAMLFASDQAAAARAALEPAVKGGESSESAWDMLFELYQLTGKHEAFETLALAYAARFEKSPPTWVESLSEVRDPALATGGRAFMALTSILNAKSDEVLKQLLRMAAGNQWVRLDLSRLADADNGGCSLLLSALKKLRQEKRECVLNGADHLATILKRKIVPGEGKNESIWLLLLELYQRLYRQELFEETALQYAITFEVSPPSFEAPRAKSVAVPAADRVPAQNGVLSLSGEIVGAGASVFAPLLAAAEGQDEIVVDASRLQRMDFVSAGNLLNAMLALQAAGKRVRISGVSHLVAGLFAVIGIGEIATVETRKY